MAKGRRANNNDRIKQYKVKAEKVNNDKTRRKKKKHSKLKKFILICFALIVLAILIAGGVFAGIFFSDKWALTKEELIANGNTEIYDADGKLIVTLSAAEGDGNRKIIPLDQMGKYTPAAYVSIEDKRFYEHSGVDILRTAKATISYMLNKTDGTSVGGGSTITQQLVKNLMEDDAKTGKEGIERKIREMSRAYQLEQILNKDEILEKYLNIIFIGGKELCGVEYGAQYYFAKSAKDLDLAESAFLAGINNSPNMYNPYDSKNDNSELIKSRTKLVLDAMKEQNRISENSEEAEKLYNEAVEKVEKGLTFKKGNIEFPITSYFVHQAIEEVATDLAKEKDVSLTEARTMIKSGYKLYTTQKTSIQNTVIKEMAKKNYIEKTTITDKNKKKVTVQTQAGMTIIEPKTGRVVAMGGALGSDNGNNENYAISERQTGSSIKPLANVSAGLEEKVITASTIYDDNLTDFHIPNHIVKNAGGYQGLCTVRKSIEVSSNIVNMKIFSNVGKKTVIEYLHAFGLVSYNEDQDGITLAIGGAHNGSSTLQMAAAYACLANDGEYIEPTFYIKLTDANGKTVLEPKQEKRRVISEGNAYIVKNILMDVVNGSQGTGYLCRMSNMDVAVKTGTTENNGDTWLCGFTPYYAAATWNGYGDSNRPMYNAMNAQTIWANVMKSVHKNLKSARFQKPANVVTVKVCRHSGLKATSKCTSTYTEYFVKGTEPKECNSHTTIKICKETGKVANQFCPEVQEKVYTQKPEKEQNTWWKALGKDRYAIPTEKCTVHNEETSKVTVQNVVGKTEAEAKELLAGLNVEAIEGNDSTLANGVVIRQSLSEGTKVDKGVSIIITVNKLPTQEPTTPSTPTQPTTPSTPTNPTTSTQPTTPSTPTTGGSENNENSGNTSSGETPSNPATPSTPTTPTTPTQPSTPSTPTSSGSGNNGNSGSSSGASTQTTPATPTSSGNAE